MVSGVSGRRSLETPQSQTWGKVGQDLTPLLSPLSPLSSQHHSCQGKVVVVVVVMVNGTSAEPQLEDHAEEEQVRPAPGVSG